MTRVKDINMATSQSLIDIDSSNRLVINPKLNISSTIGKDASKENIKVVSIIGKARGGKSTFLNCLLTQWKDTSQNVFEMANSDKHCTSGIDIVHIPEKRIILLDFQGIYLGNSSVDPKLLLLAYILSDVIIFNEAKMLSNITLQQFEPMLSFINYLKDIKDLRNINPKLIFRISDVSLDIDPTTNMNNMLKPEDDQFQNIRNCINELFDDPFTVCTLNLDRSELKLLNENKFHEFISSHENGYFAACKKITVYLDCCKPTKTLDSFLNDLAKIVKSVNDNKEIDFKKLDIVKALGENQMHEWIESLGVEIYTDINVDGTIETYVKNVEGRIAMRDDILVKLNRNFKSIPKAIRDTRSKSLSEKINEKIEKAIAENKEKAISIMEGILQSDMQNYTLDIVLQDVSKEFNLYVAIKPLLDRIEKVVKLSSSVHNIALMEFIKWKDELITNVRKHIQGELDSYLEDLKKCELKCQELLDGFEDGLENVIYGIVAKESLIEPYDTILNVVKKDIQDRIPKIIMRPDYSCNTSKSFRIRIDGLYDMYAGGCRYSIKNRSLSVTMNNDYKAIQDKFVNLANGIISSKGIEIVASARNKILTEKGILKINIFNKWWEQLNIDDELEVVDLDYFDINGEISKICDLYITLDQYNGNLDKLNNTLYIGAYIEDKIIDVLFNSNFKTEFVCIQLVTIRNTGNLCFDCKMRLVNEYMTLDYYKQYLEPIFQRTCEKLSSKGYMYKEGENIECNGWLKFIKDITEVIVISPEVKYKYISFEKYKEIFQDDYLKLAKLDVFENQFKKELIRKVAI